MNRVEQRPRASSDGPRLPLERRVACLERELARLRAVRERERSQRSELAQRLQTLLDALPAGVVVLDQHGVVAQANPSARTLLTEPLVGERWAAVIARAFDPQPTVTGELRLRSGRTITLDTCPLGAGPGQILLFHDVTENRRLHARLAQHARLADMGRMAASLAHQIRTPLASALLYVNHLATPGLSDEKRLRFADKGLANLHRLERLITDMLIFARGEVGDRERLPVALLLAEAAEGVAARIAQTGAAVSVVQPPPELAIKGNRSMLLAALQNLLINGAEATGRGGEVHLSAESRRDAVMLEVTDNGRGIPVERRERLFEPFVTSRSRGTGLGLAVVRAVARAHGGEVEIESAPGAGSRFSLRLPSAAMDARAEHDRQPQQQEQSSEVRS